MSQLLLEYFIILEDISSNDVTKHEPSFWTFYKDNIRLSLGMTIVILGGVLGNILNIIIFNGRNMNRNTFTVILKAMAYAHLISQLGRIPLILLLNTNLDNHSDNSLNVKFLCILLEAICYSSTMMLTLLVAIYRYTAINYPLKLNSIFSRTRVRWAIAVCFLTGLFFAISGMIIMPFYCTNETADSIKRNFILIPPIVCDLVVSSVITVFAIIIFKSYIRRNSRLKTMMGSRCQSRMTNANKTSVITLSILGVFIVNEIVKDVIEIYVIHSGYMESIKSMKERTNLFKNIMHIFQLMQLIYTSYDFFLYYLLKFSTFRQDVNSLVVSICCIQPINEIITDENKSRETSEKHMLEMDEEQRL